MLTSTRKLAAIAFFIVFTTVAATLIGAQVATAQPHNARVTNNQVIRKIDKKVRHTHLYENIAGRPLTIYWGAANKCHHKGCITLNRLRLYKWTQRDIRAQYDLRLPSYIVSDLTCLHDHEGAWNDATGNGYYGGLQFLPSTWFSTVATYGLTFSVLPNVLPPLSQMIVAYDRYLEDGNSWREWSTAAVCGLS